MKQLIFDLHISADEYKKMYQGTARTVIARARDGQTVRFPANILQPFVDRNGIKGSFVIDYDQENRFKKIQKL